MLRLLTTITLLLWTANFALAQSTGCVDLSWTPPSENTDGSALTDLNGYKIYYGTESGTYPQNVDINNPAVVSYQICDLTEGTWFFAATAYNTSGIESDYSNEAVKVVTATPVVPMPPTNLVAADAVVYQIVKVDNGMVWNAVGWTSSETSCDTSYGVTIQGVTRYAVPYQNVRYASDVEPKLVMADCG